MTTQKYQLIDTPLPHRMRPMKHQRFFLLFGPTVPCCSIKGIFFLCDFLCDFRYLENLSKAWKYKIYFKLPADVFRQKYVSMYLHFKRFTINGILYSIFYVDAFYKLWTHQNPPRANQNTSGINQNHAKKAV